MKTERAIHEEALRLEELARRYWVEARPGRHRSESGSEPRRVLFHFPATAPGSEGLEDGALGVGVQRWIAVGSGAVAPVYFLMQGGAERFGERYGDGSSEAWTEASDPDVEEVLREGYVRTEEEGLAERLAPIVARLEEAGFDDGMSVAVEQVEAAIAADELAPAVRQRTRADIVEFLEGRLRPSDFIAEIVERQYERETVREIVAEWPGERLTIGQP